MATSPPPSLTVVPEGEIPEAEYAQSVFVLNSDMDMTIYFMRARPMMTEGIERAKASGKIPSRVVAAVTMPKSAAAALAATLQQQLAIKVE